MTRKMTIAIFKNTSYKLDLSSLFIIINNSNMFSKFDYAKFI